MARCAPRCARLRGAGYYARLLDAIARAGFDDLQKDPAGVLQGVAMEAGPVISVGAVSGFASGFAIKKAGKAAAVVRTAIPSPLL